MKIIMISTDRSLFREGSRARARMAEYGSLVEKLDIIVLTKKSLGFVDQVIAQNVRLYPTCSLSRWLMPRDAIQRGKEILRPLCGDSTREILITTQDPFETGWVGVSLKRSFNVPLQIQIHTDFLNPYFRRLSLANRVRSLLARFTVPRADCLRVVSLRIKKSLEGFLSPGRVPPIDVLPIFVDKTLFLPPRGIPMIDPECNLKKKYPQFFFIILMVARLTAEKNVPLALAALSRVVERYPQVGLIIVGTGPAERRCRRIVKKLTLGKHVFFERSIAVNFSHYASADLFLLTSFYEGYGLVLMEAALAGCSIVATDVGIAPVFADKGAALVCLPDDTACIVSHILRVIEDNELRERLRVRAREVAESLTEDKSAHLAQHRSLFERCGKSTIA